MYVSYVHVSYCTIFGNSTLWHPNEWFFPFVNNMYKLFLFIYKQKSPILNIVQYQKKARNPGWPNKHGRIWGGPKKSENSGWATPPAHPLDTPLPIHKKQKGRKSRTMINNFNWVKSTHTQKKNGSMVESPSRYTFILLQLDAKKVMGDTVPMIHIQNNATIPSEHIQSFLALPP